MEVFVAPNKFPAGFAVIKPSYVPLKQRSIRTHLQRLSHRTTLRQLSLSAPPAVGLRIHLPLSSLSSNCSLDLQTVQRNS